jgi:hypothetical protein
VKQGLLLAGIVLVLLPGSRIFGQAVAEDDRGREALVAFESKLRTLPIDHDVRYVSFLCMSLPVRDKSTGQIGDGHPGERDAKFSCMLEFLTVLDQLAKDDLPVAYLNVAGEGVPIAGMDPGDVKDPEVREEYIAAIKAGNAAIEQHNFQMELREMRRKYAVFLIPAFIRYDYPASAKNEHLREIIRDGLKSDPRAKDLMASLLNDIGSR